MFLDQAWIHPCNLPFIWKKYTVNFGSDIADVTQSDWARTRSIWRDGGDHIGLIGGLSFTDLVIAQGNGMDTATANTVICTSSGEYLAVLLDVSAIAMTQSDFRMLSA